MLLAKNLQEGGARKKHTEESTAQDLHSREKESPNAGKEKKKTDERKQREPARTLGGDGNAKFTNTGKQKKKTTGPTKGFYLHKNVKTKLGRAP